MDQTEEFLKILTEAHGVPGYETEVRALLRGYMEPLGAVTQDKLGSLVCHKAGSGPKVMLVGHMDEIGFLVTHITDDGFIKFQQLGGWWDQVLLGHRVIIKSHKGQDVIGVIGAKAPHLLTDEERNKLVQKKDMYVDIGARSAAEVREAGVRPGDAIVPHSDFTRLANGRTYLSKAFDNRVGCALVVDVLRHFQENVHPNHLYGVQTVMEEVGLRGATTTVRMVNPDVAIILESGIAGDVPGITPAEADVRLGGGPNILIYDRLMIPNLKLRNLVIDTAEALNIPVQYSAMYGGSTDGGPIHLHNTGVPTVVLAVPTRHVHSHGGIIHRDDYDWTLKLVAEVVGRLDTATVADLTQ